MEKSPLNYPLTKALQCFDPNQASDLSKAEKKLAKTLEIFVAHKIINGIQADKIEQEYKAVCTPNTAQMKHFKRQDTKLQEFWFDLLGNEYPNLKDFLKKVFILSHGNAALERGFLVNKECLVENLTRKIINCPKNSI